MQRVRNQRRGRRGGRNGENQAVAHPPQFVATKMITSRSRFRAAAANGALSVTRAILLNTLVMNSASGTTNYRLFSGIRLRSIEMWFSSASSTTPISVEWTSTYGPSRIVSDSPVGTAQPAHVKSTPPPQSLASFWSLTGQNESEVVMILSYDTPAFIDITYDAILQNGEAAVSVTTTANGAVGRVYHTYLSGVTTTDLVPVSYTPIT
jgi:hypothetical protein